MLDTVEDLTAMIEMLESDIAMFGPAGDDLSRLRDYRGRRAALVCQAQEKSVERRAGS